MKVGIMQPYFFRNRPVRLSTTHILRAEDESDFDIGQP